LLGLRNSLASISGPTGSYGQRWSCRTLVDDLHVLRQAQSSSELEPIATADFFEPPGQLPINDERPSFATCHGKPWEPHITLEADDSVLASKIASGAQG
jgi:hypothetical protein